jgi:hypothetical protein
LYYKYISSQKLSTLGTSRGTDSKIWEKIVLLENDWQCYYTYLQNQHEELLQSETYISTSITADELTLGILK